jgi:Xaa-Pro dipeptidase
MTSGSKDAEKSRRYLVQDPRRLADVEEKHTRIREFLAANEADAVLLQDPANIAWFTAGADIGRCSSDSCLTSVFVTEEARLFATNAVDSAQLFEREAFGLGFQLKQREWFQPHSALVEDLCRGRKVVSDSGIEGTRGVGKALNPLRLPLTDLDVDRLRKLSRVVLHAVEVTAGRIRRGMTESAVAGEISHRLLRRTVTPVRIQVCADGRNARFRHWTFGEDPIESFATVTCIARRWGLHVALSRTVCLDKVPADLWAAHQKAVMIHATGMYFSQHAESLKNIWPRVQRIYEKNGLSSEWQLSDQADVSGYRPSEHQLSPSSDFTLHAPCSVYWHPSVAAAMTGDTILVLPNGCEILTRSEAWPELRVQVKGHDIPCPGLLLIREKSTTEPAMNDQPTPDETKTPTPVADSSNDVFGLEDEPEASRVDSTWELDLHDDASVFDEEESQYSRESVLD